MVETDTSDAATAVSGPVRREIVIRAGDVAIRATLYDTPTADQIWAALPLHAAVKTWGAEVYFGAEISSKREPSARDVVAAGEIVYWPDGGAIAIGFGPTPLSRNGEIRLAGLCNIWARAVDDVAALRRVYAGQRISIAQA